MSELQHLSLATTYEVDDSFDSDKFIKLRLRVSHDGINPNKSSFTLDCMEDAKESIKNIPILANVIFDEDGTPNFGGHDMEIEEDKCNEGQYRLIYKETPIGLVPESCNYEIKEFNGKNYAFCDAYCWKGYMNYAQDIIERDKDIKLSMEILVDEYNYNAKEKCYNIVKYRHTGITFLNKDFGTGMENALATTGTFSEDNTKEKFIIMMQELKDTLTQYNIDNNQEGGQELVDEKIIALLQQYNVTQEELTFSIEGLSFEEVDAKLKELYSNTNNSEEGNKQEQEKFIKSFELSHSEIRYALYQLLSPVEVEDNEWYFIDQVYDDRFEYENWDGIKIFRQGYKREDDNVSFDGDRIELFQERLTREEKDALDKMRSEFTEFEKLKSDFTSMKEEKENLEIQFSTVKSDLEKVNTELEKLNTYKLQKETEEKNKVFAKFEGLTEDDIKSIKENITSYSLSELEEKLLVVWAKKKMEFEKLQKEKGNENNQDKLIFALTNSKENKDQDLPIYADILSKYNK